MEIAKTQQQMEERFKDILSGVNNVRRLDGRTAIQFESCNLEKLTFHGSHIVSNDEINSLEHMHGGVIAWYLETASGLLVCAYTNVASPTSDLHIHYLRSPSLGDNLDIHSSILKMGSKIVVTRCEIYCGSTLYAESEGTTFIL